MQYQLKIEQLVTYPRCRIYRKFLESLSADRSIRTNGSSCLFYFLTLCSLANFRKSTLRIDGSTHIVNAGEWILPVRDLTERMRTKTDKSTLAVLEEFQSKQYITYSLTHQRRYVKFKITDWDKFNTSLAANAPCHKDAGFFFFPYRMVSEFIGNGKSSEMDIILDLWLNTIYKDDRIAGSDVGSVVYYRNGTHSPLIGYEDLGRRWGVSKSTAGRILRKLEEHGYLKLVPFQGNYGTAICVPKSHLHLIVRKVAKVIFLQGIACASCTHARYRLSYLSDDCKRQSILTELLIRCPGGGEYRFTVDISPYPVPLSQSESEVV